MKTGAPQWMSSRRRRSAVTEYPDIRSSHRALLSSHQRVERDIMTQPTHSACYPWQRVARVPYTLRGVVAPRAPTFAPSTATRHVCCRNQIHGAMCVEVSWLISRTQRC
eukprot:353000-Chlamydomonas_euryale.AAC.22